jgi:protein-tyrosine phosphatase
VLVSALERSEEQDLDLVQENAIASGIGLRYVPFPVPDRGLPEMRRTLEMIAELKALLSAEASVAVHCRMGIGRSSLLCAAVMVTYGSPPDRTWQILTSARQMSVPDTEEQRQWLYSFQRSWEALNGD